MVVYEVGQNVLFYSDDDKFASSLSWEEIPDATLYRKKANLGIIKEVEAESYRIQYLWMGMAYDHWTQEEYIRAARMQSWVGWFGSAVDPTGYNPGNLVVVGLCAGLVFKFYKLQKK